MLAGGLGLGEGLGLATRQLDPIGLDADPGTAADAADVTMLVVAHDHRMSAAVGAFAGAFQRIVGIIALATGDHLRKS